MKDLFQFSSLYSNLPQFVSNQFVSDPMTAVAPDWLHRIGSNGSFRSSLRCSVSLPFILLAMHTAMTNPFTTSFIPLRPTL